MKKLKKTIINVVAPIVSATAIAGCSLTGEAYNLNVVENENGEISVNKESAIVGEEVVITAIPDYSYALKKILVGEEVCAHDENNVCKYIMTSGNKEIKVEFYKLSEVQVNFNYNDSHVLLNMISENEVYYPGDVVEFKLNLENGYEIEKVNIGETELTPDDDNIYTYTIPDSVASIDIDVITLELENYSRLDFVTTNHVDVLYDSRLYGDGTTVNLDDIFIIDEDYLADYYVVNGERINGHSYTVDEDAMIEVVITRKLKVTYISGNHTTVTTKYEYYKHGDVINLNKFTFEDGYEIDYYLVDGVKVSDVNYTIGNEDVTVSVKAKIKQFKVTYIGGEHVTSTQAASYYVKGDVIQLDKFTFEEGYELDYYTIDGERYEDSTYVITNTSVTISAVARVETFAITYVASDHSFTNEVIEDQVKGTIVDLNKFTFEEGYELDYYTVNGVRVDNNTYTIDDEDVVISIVAKKIVLQVTFQGIENAEAVNASQSYNYGDVITLPVNGNDTSSLFNIAEGYFVDYCTINGEEVDISEYRVTENVTISIKLIKGIRVTYVDGTNTTTTEEAKYIMPNNTIDLNKFTIPEGYRIKHYLVNGEITKDNNYLVTNEDVTISAVAVNKVSVTLNSVTHATANEYYQTMEVNVGEEVYLDYYQVDEGYIIDHYIINDEIAQEYYYYEVGVDDIVVTPVVVKAVKITYVAGENYTVCYETEYVKPNREFYIGSWYFNFSEGYVVDYYMVNDQKIDGNTYMLTTEDITISLVARNGVRVIFNAVEHASVSEGYDKYYVSPNEEVYLGWGFDIDEGYVISGYLVNGEQIEDSSYEVGEDSITVTPIVVEGVKVTYTSVEHAESYYSNTVYRAPNEEIYINEFTLDDGYTIDYYLINGVRCYDRWYYQLGTEDITVVPVVKRTEILKSDYIMHGNITLSKTEIKTGDVVTITVTADEGYIYAPESLTVNGELVNGNTYTVTEAYEDLYVWAAFVPEEEKNAKLGTYVLSSVIDLSYNENSSQNNPEYYTDRTFVELLSDNTARMAMYSQYDSGSIYAFVDIQYEKTGNLFNVTLSFDDDVINAKSYMLDDNTLVFCDEYSLMIFNFKDDVEITQGTYAIEDEDGNDMGTAVIEDNTFTHGSNAGEYIINGNIMYIEIDSGEQWICKITEENDHYLVSVLVISDGESYYEGVLKLTLNIQE